MIASSSGLTRYVCLDNRLTFTTELVGTPIAYNYTYLTDSLLV